MTEVERISDQLKRAFEGDAWHGPSVMAVLEGLTAPQAQLDQSIVEGLATIYVTLHRIIQHDLYHAGQIAILKKATLEGARNERTSK